MRVRVFEVAWDGPGRLATMPHPPGGNNLPAGMATLADAGVDVLVSALCDDEMAMLDLEQQPAEAQRAGLELIRFPIEDRSVPESLDDAVKLADQLAAQLQADRFVVTHCYAGIGRSSLLAATTLVRLGTAPETAWDLIRTARGLPVPDLPHQEQWLYQVPRG
jgi:protein-tyrosine phosphatase